MTRSTSTDTANATDRPPATGADLVYVRAAVGIRGELTTRQMRVRVAGLLASGAVSIAWIVAAMVAYPPHQTRPIPAQPSVARSLPLDSGGPVVCWADGCVAGGTTP